MKRLHLIEIMVFAICVAGCVPHPRESERMASAMAQAEAVYGDGSLQVETDTALFIPGLAEASDYYARRRQYGKAALAALYNGYTDRDFNKEAAMVSFKEAERYGELAHDSLTMARAEYWMGRFLFEENRNEEALPLFKASSDRIGTSLIDKAIVENSLAVVYIVLKQFDSAEICLQNSLDYAQDCCLDQMEWKIINNYSVLHRVRGEYDLSLDYQRGMLRKPWLDDAKRVYVYLNLGNAFMAMSEMDSAALYYQRLDSIVQVVSVRDDTKVSVYGALLRFAKTQGDDTLALRYYDQHESALFEFMNTRQKQAVYRIQKQYDYETMLNDKNRSIAKRQSIIIVLCAGLALLSTVLFVLQRRLAVKTKQEAIARERILYYVQQYRESLVKQGETMRKVAIIKDHKDDKAVWDDLIKTVFGKKDPWDALVEVFDTLHPDKRKQMEKSYPTLSELEKRSYILSCLDVSRQDEALLLGINIHSIDKLRQSVRKKTTNDSISTSESS